jgi:LysM repeat protein
MRKALARIFAVLAIAVCAGAIYSVVHANFLTDNKTKTAKTSASKAKKHTTVTVHTVYVVKSGDTLSAIAHKHHVTVEKIKALNASLDDHGLQPGQKIHLR